MKFAIFVGLACLSVVISGEKETEKVWGDVSPTEAAELGRIKVQAHKTDTKPATYTFTYPDVSTIAVSKLIYFIYQINLIFDSNVYEDSS